MQTVAGGVQHDLTDVFADGKTDPVQRAGLRQSGYMMVLHQPLDHRLFYDALAGRHAGKLTGQRRPLARELRVGGQQLFPGDGVHAVEQFVKGLRTVGFEQQQHPFDRAQVQVGGGDHLRPTGKAQPAVGDLDIFRTNAFQLKMSGGFAPEIARGDQSELCGHRHPFCCHKTSPSRAGTEPAHAAKAVLRPAPPERDRPDLL